MFDLTRLRELRMMKRDLVEYVATNLTENLFQKKTFAPALEPKQTLSHEDILNSVLLVLQTLIKQNFTVLLLLS